MNDPGFAALADRLEGLDPRTPDLRVVVGFDGTVDKILSAVHRRSGASLEFAPVPTIADFGRMITDAAGKSTQIELHPHLQKIGGNGPIMANALAACGCATTYLGPLGHPEIAPTFREFADRVEVLSIGNPAETNAIEFEDGKVMLPVLLPYHRVTPEAILERVGRERLLAAVAPCRLLAPLSWTCLPHLDAILDLFLGDILPAIGADPDRLFFFDLADPNKRSDEEIRGVLDRIRRFGAFGQVVLGLNFSEAIRVSAVLGLPAPDRGEAALTEGARCIREAAGLGMALIHPTECAACAGPGGVAFTGGPLCRKPLITTGAGDHLNAGFCLGLMLGLEPLECLRLGVLFSGYYVRTGRSPDLAAIRGFARTGETTP